MIIGIIPSRYESSRLPGKPLIDLKGKSMIQRVYEQAKKSALLNQVIVATDEERIFAHVTQFGGEVMMTNKNHQSGTDRCCEVVEKLKIENGFVINIQGDEPLIEPQQIDELARVLDDNTIEIATQMIPITNYNDLENEGEVKIVLNKKSEALYFSRSAIPYLKNVEQKKWLAHHKYFRHVGMYAYRIDILKQLAKLPVSTLEKVESLEQLRWLENGYTIKCIETKFESHCVDTREDVERIMNLITQ